MIRLAVEAKFWMDLSKLAIFVSENDVTQECKNAVLELLKTKSMYIGSQSVYRYCVRTCYYSGIIATELGALLNGPNALRYVHLREMFGIAHKIFHNAASIENEAFQEACINGSTL